MLPEFLNKLRETGFIPVSVLPMDNTVGGGFIKQRHNLGIFFLRFVFAGFIAQIPHGGSQDGTITPVTQAGDIGSFNTLLTRLMVWQENSFHFIQLTVTISKNKRKLQFVNTQF